MKNAALIEMLFAFGVVLALALWDLYRTPRPGRDDAAAEDADGQERDDRS